MKNLIGTVIGKYRLVELLGQSDAGEVYKGLQVGLEREVAVRILRPELSRDSLTMARFRQESRATAQLSHPHILTIYDSGKHEDLRYYVMEVAPRTLSSRLAGGEPLPVEEALKVAEELCRALEYVHERQVYHRLLIPANIRFDLRGNSVLGGFGAEAADVYPRLEAASALGYAAPEVMLGEKTGSSTDLYQLGVVLYESLAGRLPYAGRPPFVAGGSGYLKDVTPLTKIRPEVSKDLQELVWSCLQDRPAARPTDATELRKTITKVKRKYEVRALSRQVASQATPKGLSTDRIPTRAMDGSQVPGASGSGRPLSQSTPVVKAVQVLTGGHGDLSKQETRIRLAAVVGPFLVLLLIGGLWLAGLLGAPSLTVLESLHEIEAREVTVSWKSNRPCFGFVEFTAEGGSSLRTRPSASKQTVFRQTLKGLRPATTYRYRIALSHAPDGSGAQYAVERDVETEEALEVREVRVSRVDGTSATIRWKTNRPADSKVRFWRGASPSKLKENPELSSDLDHSVTLHGLNPDTAYQYQVVSQDVNDRDQVTETKTRTFTTAKSRKGKGSRQRLIETYVKKTRALSPAELAKLEASLADLLGSGGDLDAEQKVLVALGKTERPEAFFRRRRLAVRWALQLEKSGKVLPKPPAWSPKEKLPATLDYLKDFYEVGSRKRAYGRLDECIRQLARVEGIPVDGAGP